jgi:hypothetical protein
VVLACVRRHARKARRERPFRWCRCPEEGASFEVLISGIPPGGRIHPGVDRSSENTRWLMGAMASAPPTRPAVVRWTGKWPSVGLSAVRPRKGPAERGRLSQVAARWSWRALFGDFAACESDGPARPCERAVSLSRPRKSSSCRSTPGICTEGAAKPCGDDCTRDQKLMAGTWDGPEILRIQCLFSVCIICVV